MERTVFFAVLLAVAVAAAVAGTIQTPPIPKIHHRSHADLDAADRHDRAMHPDDGQLSHSATRSQSPQENQNHFWLDNGQDFVQQQLHKSSNRRRAKNVVLFLGDGMSATTIAATRSYVRSEETYLSWERFPAVGSSKTYCVDYQVADSACSSTAYLSGVKANYGTLGVTANVTRYSCTDQLDPTNHVSSIAQWAVDAGKVAGLVTTSGVTDASPAGLYAHSSNRYFENDEEVRKRCDPTLLPDIARQLIESDLGSRLRVIMGGARADFRPLTRRDEEGYAGARGDGRDLIEEWLAKKTSEKAAYVWNATELRSLHDVDYLLALFEPGSLQYNREVQAARRQDTEPALHEMTRAAIEVLRRHDEGFFLFVEGGKIDSAHHGTYARLALDETAELSRAVEVARAMLPEEDTLIVVTSDHSHTMSYAGYPDRGNDITGLSGPPTEDLNHYMTLGYANGPGYTSNIGPDGRIDADTLDKTPLRFRFPAMNPASTETHAGEDVLVYASGPWAHLFSGNYEQSVIPYLMAYSSCLNGVGPQSCTD